MDYFKYINRQLFCEHVNVNELAKEVGTPSHLYSTQTPKDHYTNLTNAFQELNPEAGTNPSKLVLVSASNAQVIRKRENYQNPIAFEKSPQDIQCTHRNKENEPK